MDSNIKIGIEKLIAMFIIANGEWNGEEWEYFPKLPTPFCENLIIKFPKCVFNGDLLSLRVNDKCGVELWFIDNNEEQYYFAWESIKECAPILAAVVITHIYDMIENIEE
jgi:hypothetical protein